MTTARATHSTSTRLRVRVDGSAREVRAALTGLEKRARAHPGMTTVTVDHERGSALLEWDPEHLDPEMALKLVREAHRAFENLAPPVIVEIVEKAGSNVAMAIKGSLGRADSAVLRATRGAVDLRMLVPIGLGSLALRQLFRTGPALPAIPWYALAYYSFDTFVKMHGTGASAATETTA